MHVLPKFIVDFTAARCQSSTAINVIQSLTFGSNSLFFKLINKQSLFSHRPLENDDLFICRLLTTPIFHVVYPVFFLNSAKK